MEEFFTQETANEGIKIPLQTPDGSKSEHWVIIHSVDSDAYHRANAKGRRAVSKTELEAAAMEDKQAREDFILERQKEAETEIIAALVKDWSFKEEPHNLEPTFENKVNFLTKAPQIAERINFLAGQRRLFIKTGSED